MPQVYRRHSEHSPRPAPTPRRRTTVVDVPELTDADDSIVLSDLVRTGEASRLRRRGAMRLDHGLTGAPRPASMSIPPPVILTGPPGTPRRQFALPAQPPRPVTPPGLMGDFGDDISESWQEMRFDEPGPGSRPVSLDEQRRAVEHEDDEESFVLYCGGEVAKVSSVDYSKPFEPSPLPFSQPSSSRPARPASPPTNGCGAIIHLRAFPQKHDVWVGKREATENVVALDSAYFERNIVTRMVKSACGCVREGVGCAACGNPLGTRYMPCHAASEGIFSTRNKHPAALRPTRPLHPSGPQYWGPSHTPPAPRQDDSADPSQSTTDSAFYVYWFFADHVTSSPARPPSRTEQADAYSRPPSPRTTSWFGLTPTASPRPYSPAFAPNPASPEPPSPGLIVPLSPYLSPRAGYRTTAFYDPPAREPDDALAYPASDAGDDSASTVLAPADEDRYGVDVDLVELDADGVPIEREAVLEPGSPDKTEIFTWPGR